MPQKVSPWLSAWLVGLLVFIPWKFFFASPNHLDSFGLLKSGDWIHLMLGALCGILVSSLFLLYPKGSSNNPQMTLFSIFNHIFRLFLSYFLIMPPAQIHSWTCWTRETQKRWLEYTYNKLRDTHYLKSIDLKATCPPDALKHSRVFSDIEMERLEHYLADQNNQCYRTTASIFFILLVFYVVICNLVPFFCTTEKKKAAEKEYETDEDEVNETNTREFNAAVLNHRR